MTRWLLALVLITVVVGGVEAAPNTLELQSGWWIQASSAVPVGGEVVSTARYQPNGWTKATVPSTVLAAQVAAGRFKAPYDGMNLRSIPGTTYAIGNNFSNEPMSPDSPYSGSWWYRTSFRVPEGWRGRTAWLRFDGINYCANVWINGHRVADAEHTAGAYRVFEFPVSVRPGQDNVLAVETFAPRGKDLAMNWVDWNPMPPDKEMGLWQGVSLSATGPVAIRHPMVATHFVDASLQEADLTVETLLNNASGAPVQGVLQGQIGSLRFEQPVTVPEGGLVARFTPDRFPQLKVQHPQVWWPYPHGPQTLQTLQLQFVTGSAASDTAQIRFGIREVTSEMTDQGARLFKVNGRRLLIRGGGWAPDMMLRQTPQRLRDEFQYVRHLGLNAIRLEGKMESEDFFNLADEQGVLVIAGWCCCDIWEDWDKWEPVQHQVASESLRSQLLRLRSHPSLLVWLYGSDNPPPADVEKEYLQVIKDTDWPNPFLSSASGTATAGAGETGVKMTGPYDYVPPSYWLNATASTDQYGGAFRFITETSPGAAIPTEKSIRKFIPADHLWPVDEVWNYHAGGSVFDKLDRYNDAMNAIYGPPTDLQDYVKKGQAMAYDAERAMFEAYGRNKYVSTGVVQWMLNNAWPSMIWHLYDYYLEPGGSYFGARKANEPLHVQFSYDDRSVVVVNNLYQDFPTMRVQADLYDFDLTREFTQETVVDVASDSTQRVMTLPLPANQTPVSFVRLTLKDAGGQVVSNNFYWLPIKYSTFDWPKTTFVTTPELTYEDLTALNRLPPAVVQAAATHGASEVRVVLRNNSQNMAFQVWVAVSDVRTGDDILPALWDDNYVTLWPGESRTLTASYDASKLTGVTPQLEVSGWNVPHQTVRVTAW